MNESKVWMATSNFDKFKEARDVLTSLGIKLMKMDAEKVEIQADDLSEIAVFSLKQIDSGGRSIAVEDAGLFIDHYGGFPGPYSSYALHTINLTGIIKLMKDVEKRRASFRSVVAYRDDEGIRVFHGEVKGKIAQEVRGDHGFGYDPIFIPDEGDGRTFGEMKAHEKNAISHRARAFRSLGEWILSSQ